MLAKQLFVKHQEDFDARVKTRDTGVASVARIITACQTRMISHVLAAVRPLTREILAIFSPRSYQVLPALKFLISY